eukprot:GFYU01007581.1.p1 GENE.GFYU01007581.1~~GFYU01007581.1.p1  ORF type:complete len:714 (+),score=164.96 GFYU01007581.1:301-2442(+)
MSTQPNPKFVDISVSKRGSVRELSPMHSPRTEAERTLITVTEEPMDDDDRDVDEEPPSRSETDSHLAHLHGGPNVLPNTVSDPGPLVTPDATGADVTTTNSQSQLLEDEEEEETDTGSDDSGEMDIVNEWMVDQKAVQGVATETETTSVTRATTVSGPKKVNPVEVTQLLSHPTIEILPATEVDISENAGSEDGDENDWSVSVTTQVYESARDQFDDEEGQATHEVMSDMSDAETMDTMDGPLGNFKKHHPNYQRTRRTSDDADLHHQVMKAKRRSSKVKAGGGAVQTTDDLSDEDKAAAAIVALWPRRKSQSEENMKQDSAGTSKLKNAVGFIVDAIETVKEYAGPKIMLSEDGGDESRCIEEEAPPSPSHRKRSKSLVGQSNDKRKYESMPFRLDEGGAADCTIDEIVAGETHSQALVSEVNRLFDRMEQLKQENQQLRKQVEVGRYLPPPAAAPTEQRVAPLISEDVTAMISGFSQEKTAWEEVLDKITAMKQQLDRATTKKLKYKKELMATRDHVTASKDLIKALQARLADSQEATERARSDSQDSLERLQKDYTHRVSLLKERGLQLEQTIVQKVNSGPNSPTVVLTLEEQNRRLLQRVSHLESQLVKTGHWSPAFETFENKEDEELSRRLSNALRAVDVPNRKSSVWQRLRGRKNSGGRARSESPRQLSRASTSAKLPPQVRTAESREERSLSSPRAYHGTINTART